MSSLKEETEPQSHNPTEAKNTLRQEDLLEMVGGLYTCLSAIGIRNSFNRVLEGAFDSEQELEEVFVAATLQISSKELKLVISLQENEFKIRIDNRRERDQKRNRSKRYVHKMTVLAAILGLGNLAFDNAAEFAPSIMIERIRLAIMAGLLGGSLGGAWGWNRGEDSYERASYSFISAMIAFLVISIATYGTSFLASENDFIEVGVFSTKFLSSLLLLAVFVLSTIHLDEKFDEQKDKSDQLFQTLSCSTDSLSNIASYLRLLQKVSGDDKFSKQSLVEVGDLMSGWINKKVEDLQKIIFLGRDKPTLAEHRVAILTQSHKRRTDNIALDSSYRLRHFLHANGAWAYGVACWLMQMDEGEYLLFKEALRKEWGEIAGNTPSQAGSDADSTRDEGWSRLQRQLRELLDDFEKQGLANNKSLRFRQRISEIVVF